MTLFLVISLGALSCLLVAWWTRRRRFLCATSNIPALSGQLPFLGIAHHICGDKKQLWDAVKSFSIEINDCGGVVTTWLGPTVLLVAMTDPEISVKMANTCLDKPYYYGWARPFIGDGLVTSNSEVWKTHRKLLNPAFNQSVLNSFLDIFNQQSVRLVKRLSEYDGSEEFNHKPYIAETSLETICQTAMGLPDNKIGIVENTYQKALDNLLHLYFSRLRTIWKHPQSIYNMTPTKRDEDSSIKIMKDVSCNILKRGKESIMDEKSKSPDGERFKPFLKLLLDIAEDGRLSDKEIRDEVDTMIAAGYETTASSLVMTLIMIGSFSDVQEKIFKELHEIFGDLSRDVTKEDLPKLVYLDAVVKECLRYHPVVPLVARTTDKDVKIDNVTFPAGCHMVISIWGMNRHPCWGENRNEFVPDRWLSPDTLPSNPNAFAAFSFGKRMCIGKTYAMMSLKVTLVHILRKYRVKADHTKLEFDLHFTLKAVAGNMISLELR